MSQDLVTTVVSVLVLVGLAAVMLWGWRARSRSQEEVFDTVPQVPAEPGELVLPPLTGVYIGTTVAGYWQERITRAPLGFRSTGVLSAHTSGLQIDLGRDRVWIPREQLVNLRIASKLANKVVPGGGLLVVRWQVDGPNGRTELDSGFRADGRDDYPRWISLTGGAEPDTPPDAETTNDTTSVPPTTTSEEQQ